MSSILLVATGVAVATYVLLVALLDFTQDATEPTSHGHTYSHGGLSSQQ